MTPIYYEFGVGWGGTLFRYIKALQSLCYDSIVNTRDCHIYLFDSFQGLPPKMDWKGDFAYFGPGAFRHSVPEIKRLLRRLGIGPEQDNVHFVPGFFTDSLTPALSETLRSRPPSVVTVDVDYYSSAKEVLSWLRPILRDGTPFYFDGIWVFRGDPRRGVLAAVNEFNSEGMGKLVPYPVLGSQYMIGRAFNYVTPTNQ
ncbi:MAG: hypothetical protein JRN21_05155 [Nitrososphaerota archaeon]|nr:hypothetical protein [Nitrososphaerota archaeon]